METLKIMLGNIRQRALWWQVPFAFSGVCLVLFLPLVIVTAIVDPAEAVRILRPVGQVLAVTVVSAVVLLFLAWLVKDRRARKLRH